VDGGAPEFHLDIQSGSSSGRGVTSFKGIRGGFEKVGETLARSSGEISLQAANRVTSPLCVDHPSLRLEASMSASR
jgi:hypothetical protein